MNNKKNEAKTVKHKILRSLYDRNLIDSNERIIIASGFEDAIIGVSDTTPKMIVYDYWVAIDVLIQKANMYFDDAEDWLDSFSRLNNEKDNDESVLFIKTLNPKLNY